MNPYCPAPDDFDPGTEAENPCAGLAWGCGIVLLLAVILGMVMGLN